MLMVVEPDDGMVLSFTQITVLVVLILLSIQKFNFEHDASVKRMSSPLMFIFPAEIKACVFTVILT